MWDYRVFDRDGVLTIHEVYYDEDGDVIGYTVEPVIAEGETIKELTADLYQILGALRKPVLDWEEEDDEIDCYY